MRRFNFYERYSASNPSIKPRYLNELSYMRGIVRKRVDFYEGRLSKQKYSTAGRYWFKITTTNPLNTPNNLINADTSSIIDLELNGVLRRCTLLPTYNDVDPSKPYNDEGPSKPYASTGRINPQSTNNVEDSLETVEYKISGLPSIPTEKYYITRDTMFEDITESTRNNFLVSQNIWLQRSIQFDKQLEESLQSLHKDETNQPLLHGIDNAQRYTVDGTVFSDFFQDIINHNTHCNYEPTAPPLPAEPHPITDTAYVQSAQNVDPIITEVPESSVGQINTVEGVGSITDSIPERLGYTEYEILPGTSLQTELGRLTGDSVNTESVRLPSAQEGIQSSANRNVLNNNDVTGAVPVNISSGATTLGLSAPFPWLDSKSDPEIFESGGPNEPPNKPPKPPVSQMEPFDDFDKSDWLDYLTQPNSLFYLSLFTFLFNTGHRFAWEWTRFILQKSQPRLYRAHDNLLKRVIPKKKKWTLKELILTIFTTLLGLLVAKKSIIYVGNAASDALLDIMRKYVKIVFKLAVACGIFILVSGVCVQGIFISAKYINPILTKLNAGIVGGVDKPIQMYIVVLSKVLLGAIATSLLSLHGSETLQEALIFWKDPLAYELTSEKTKAKLVHNLTYSLAAGVILYIIYYDNLFQRYLINKIPLYKLNSLLSCQIGRLAVLAGGAQLLRITEPVFPRSTLFYFIYVVIFRLYSLAMVSSPNFLPDINIIKNQ